MGKAPGVMAAVALLCVAGCTSRSSQEDSRTGTQPITVAWNGDHPTYNTQRDNAGDVTAQRQVLGGVLSGFWHVDSSGNPAADTDLGTVAKISDKPLQVRYTLNPKAVWSDGHAIDCDDLMLAWAAHSGRVIADGRPVFRGTVSDAARDTKVPSCTAGSRSLTITYSRVNSDWQSLFGGAEPLLPAHVVEKAAGMTPSSLIAAVKAQSADRLKPAAAVWNRPDWPSEPSSGPYTLGPAVDGQTVTLRANPRWWGQDPRTGTVVFRHVEDSEMPQALVNAEVDVAAPRTTIATMEALTAQGSATAVTRVGSQRYEQVQFNPASRFRDPVLRRAMATCVPRDDMVAHFATPLDPGAAALDTRLIMPFRGDYRNGVKVAGVQRYTHNDVPAAGRMVASRKATGMTVRLAYPAGDVLRATEAKRIFDACGGAGFKTRLTPVKKLTSTNHDVALTDVNLPAFPGQAAAEIAQPAKKTRALTRLLQGQLAPEAQQNAQLDLERELGNEVRTLPLYVIPNVAATRGVNNVSPTVDPAGLTWNLKDWARS